MRAVSKAFAAALFLQNLCRISPFWTGKEERKSGPAAHARSAGLASPLHPIHFVFRPARPGAFARPRRFIWMELGNPS